MYALRLWSPGIPIVVVLEADLRLQERAQL